MASIFEEIGMDLSLLLQLHGLMKLEIRQHIAIYFTSKNKAIGEVTRDIRDKAARNIRLISNIFDLPSEIFLTSIVIMDRYLSRVQVKANRINIISLGSFNLACSLASKMFEESQIKIPSHKDIIIFLERPFKETDYYQIKKILSKEICSAFPIVLTPLTFKRIYDQVMTAVAIKLNLFHTYKNIAETFDTERAMEIVACDSDSMIFCAREIALCVLFIEINQGLRQIQSVSTPEMYKTAKRLRLGIGLLQAICKVTNERFIYCFATVNLALIKYSQPKQYTSFKVLAPQTSMLDKNQKFSSLTTVSESDELNEM